MNPQESRPEPVKGPGTKPSPNGDADEFKRKTGLDGKTDSGPEPDVHGRDIPPQDP